MSLEDKMEPNECKHETITITTTPTKATTTTTSTKTFIKHSLSNGKLELNDAITKATANNTTQNNNINFNNDDLLLCSICNMKLKEPKLLDCLHVNCKNCLNQQIQVDNQNELSVKCIQCKQVTKINGTNSDCLEDDYVMYNMLDMYAIEQMKIECTSCKTNEKAVARCADCANFLCPNCVIAHQYMRCFENHTVVKFEDIKCNGNGMPIHKPLFCKTHQTESLKFFCNTCDIPICTECVVSLHKQPMHNYERLSEAESKHLQKLTKLVCESKEKINYCKEQFMNLESLLTNVQEFIESQRSLVEDTYETFVSIIEKRKNEILKELDEIHSKKELNIMDMHNQIDLSISKIDNCIKFTERILNNGNNLEILLVKRYIVNQLNKIYTNLPDTNKLNLNIKFKYDKNKFEEMLYETFCCKNLNDSSDRMQTSQYNSESPLSGEHDWFMNMVNCDDHKSTHLPIGMNGMNGINGHYNDSPPYSEQDWLINITKPTQNGGLQFDNDHTNMSPPPLNLLGQSTLGKTNGTIAPISTVANDWYMPPKNGISNGLMNGTQTTSVTTLSTTSSTGLAKNTQKSHSPIESNGFLSSRSETPGLTNGIQYDSMTQNLNQLTKLVLPQTSSGIGMANPTNTAATTNTSSSVSPPLGDADSFSGNGNLNPPVRNTKMSHMQIRCKFGQLGPAKGQFNSPHGFCLGNDEEIIVADTNNHRIQIFDKNGEFKYQFGIPGREEGQLWYPRKITVIRQSGKFIICDRGNERSRMQIFNKSGHFIKKIAIRYIDIVAGLAITNQGNIVAVDSVSPTVFCISEAGDLLKWFDCSDHMREPSDIAISGNEYYVCDFKGHCVVVFNEDGEFLRRVGGENITNFPNGIDVSDAGDVLVGDSHGNRFHIAVFTREGQLVSEFECPYVKVSRCCGLKITSEGYVVTLAKNNHHVLILNTLYVQ